MSDLYEYQAIDGSSKGPVDLVLLLRARNLGRLFYPLHDCYG